MASTYAFGHPPRDCQDPPGVVSSDLPSDTVIHPSDPAPSICDNLSQLSDFSDGSEVRQGIDHAAGSNIGQSFLASYNRSDTWVSILNLRIPQPLQTIEAIQLLGKQSRLVLVLLFSVGSLPSKHGQDAQLTSGGCQKDVLSADYSKQLWSKLGPKGYLRTLLKARAASSQLITMLKQQTEAEFSEGGLYDLDEIITDFQQELALGQEEDTVSNDGFEEVAPTTMLSDDILLLDSAVLMIDELVSPAGKAWNDRHTISDALTPPLQDPAV